MAFDKKQKEIPVLSESRTSGGWVSYGRDNKYAEYLFNMYNQNALVKSIIAAIVDYTCADITSRYERVNSNGDDITDIMRKCTRDYMIFGGFALIVNRSIAESNYQSNTTRSIEYISFKNLRTDSCREKFWYHPDWSKRRGDAIEYNAFRPWSNDEHMILYVCGDNTSPEHTYPFPIYSGALKDIETSCEISNFHLSSVLNNFNVSAIVNFNNGIPSEKAQHEIENRVNEKFTGSGNAARTLVTFNDSRENAVTIERLSEDNFDQKYNALSDTIHENIYTAFRMNPILVGVNVQTGFSKQEFNEAYDLFFNTVIVGIQKLMSRSLQRVGIDATFGKLSVYADDTTVNSDGTVNQE